ncbi:DUF2807 domain-containing protein [Flavobacteriaceae bacterium F89]|uniref:DUF2807 domain-containing protein n=1 Tax=Cerina litoralis TaxID=2874477 RepID=A0AAE3JN70_9FLAO|nr:head GIN domain-containing protein [Cerina litoralis]MCG2459571.1 DUF2807 domain-containing protein [Cerina litoralis]
MKKIQLLGLALLFTAATHAQWSKKINGNGNVVTIDRTTADYDALEVSGSFDVELVVGKEGKLSLTGEENLLQYIVTEVKNGNLIIKTEKGIYISPSHNKGISLRIPVETIDAVSLSGSGDIVGRTKIRTDNFKTALSGSGDVTLDVEANSVVVSMSGSGDIVLKGKSTNIKINVSGSGDIDTYGLAADHVDASISGSADVDVTANQSLKVRVSGSGDISYRGNPQKIDTKSSGSGDISKR